MNPTNYTIELLISGICGSIWLFISSLIFLGNWVDVSILNNVNSVILTFFIVPMIYVLGVLIDRTTTLVFGKKTTKKLRLKHFDNEDSYKRARSKIYINSDNLLKIIEYNRMRIRICRNWIFNGLLILIFSNIFLIKNQIVNYINIGLYISIFLLISVYISFISWKKLHEKEYKFLKIQSNLIK